ncbi:protein of unknown function [Thermococcus camini]|uniref:Uncharacterized protein n=1 Tax=Thermococcus camini TaxID=2016373 RepID=A0A7G2D5C6_9EURY|nr:protein of unknown function [Thermococcus camini]
MVPCNFRDTSGYLNCHIYYLSPPNRTQEVQKYGERESKQKVMTMIRIIEAKIPANANGDSILTLAYNLPGVSNHAFKLFLDNLVTLTTLRGDCEWTSFTLSFSFRF